MIWQVSSTKTRGILKANFKTNKGRNVTYSAKEEERMLKYSNIFCQ